MDYLCHHGTKGMKWHRRLFQNKDGSLTDLGRIHYGIGKSKSKGSDLLKNAGSIGKKAAKATRFGVATLGAQKEHYAKEAGRSVTVGMNKLRRASANVGRALNTQKSMADQLRNVGNQISYANKRSINLRNLMQQSSYKERYKAGKNFIQAMKDVGTTTKIASRRRFKQRVEFGRAYVFGKTLKENMPSTIPGRKLSKRGELMRSRKTADWVSGEYDSTTDAWRKNIRMHVNDARSNWKIGRGKSLYHFGIHNTKESGKVNRLRR